IHKDPNCNNLSHYKNDIKEALEAIGHWILNIASTSNKLKWQKKV
ncbi:10824_t:CDS:1, partial [Funneliformis mosseae]